MAEIAHKQLPSFHLPSKSHFLQEAFCGYLRKGTHGAHVCAHQAVREISQGRQIGVRGNVKFSRELMGNWGLHDLHGSKPLLLEPYLSLPGKNGLNFAKSSIFHEKLETHVSM